MSRAQRDQRAQSKIGVQNMHCCKYVGYIINGDESQNRGGAAGWKTWGSATNDPQEASVIVLNGGTHVGYVTNGGKSVYDSPGAGRNKPIRCTDFNTFIKWFNSYELKNDFQLKQLLVNLYKIDLQFNISSFQYTIQAINLNQSLILPNYPQIIINKFNSFNWFLSNISNSQQWINTHIFRISIQNP